LTSAATGFDNALSSSEPYASEQFRHTCSLGAGIQWLVVDLLSAEKQLLITFDEQETHPSKESPEIWRMLLIAK
jgi:hypothetical protein